MARSNTVRFPKGKSQVSRNGRGGGNHPADADARYAAALRLVQVIDHNLQTGTQHYYDIQGRLLSTLDEVIHAMLTDSLVLGRPAEYPQNARAVQWVPVGELVA